MQFVFHKEIRKSTFTEYNVASSYENALGEVQRFRNQESKL